MLDPELKEQHRLLFKKACRLLARREYAAVELRQKWRMQGVPSLVIEAVIQSLQEKSWQSDERYMASWIRARAARGYGPKRIALELQQRGLDKESIRQAFLQTDVNWQEVFVRCQQKYFPDSDMPIDGLEKQRREAFFLKKGFSEKEMREATD
jgi:regulatory protein